MIRVPLPQLGAVILWIALGLACVPRSDADSGCPNMMVHLAARVRTPKLQDKRLYPTVRKALQDAGGLDRAIVLTRLQIKETSQKLDQVRANTELKESMPDLHRETVTLLEDQLMLNQAYLEAFECYRQ
jgi:hypothetical protein